MKKQRKISLGKQEEWRNKRAKHIVFEKEYTETCAAWMVKRIEGIDRLHAIRTRRDSLLQTRRNVLPGEGYTAALRNRLRAAV